MTERQKAIKAPIPAAAITAIQEALSTIFAQFMTRNDIMIFARNQTMLSRILDNVPLLILYTHFSLNEVNMILRVNIHIVIDEDIIRLTNAVDLMKSLLTSGLIMINNNPVTTDSSNAPHSPVLCNKLTIPSLFGQLDFNMIMILFVIRKSTALHF